MPGRTSSGLRLGATPGALARPGKTGAGGGPSTDTMQRTAVSAAEGTLIGAKPGKGARPRGDRHPPRAVRMTITRRPVSREQRGRTIRAGRRRMRKVLLLVACAVIAAGAGAAYILLRPAKAHSISVPTAIGSYTEQPKLANSTALPLKSKIVSAAAGKVRNVVAAVYQKGGLSSATGAEVYVFIGGNLAGGESASSFISGMLTLPGSFSTSAGTLGGSAACTPGTHGAPAECAWADNDTFGVLVSATMNAQGLAAELRQMRSLVEHVVK
jgi:hypothetical protein